MLRSPALLVTALAIVLTIAFHFLPGVHPGGLPIALFSLLLICGVVVVAAASRVPLNGWAAIFLLPALAGITAEGLYASPVVELFAPLLILTSLALFAFWLTVHRTSFWSVNRLWPTRLASDTLFPFQHLDGFLSNLETGKRGGNILIGITIAIPFLIVFGALFASADPLFHKAVTDPFKELNLGMLLGRIVRDLIIGFYLLAAGWTMHLRLSKDRPADHPHTATPPSTTITATFLGLMNALFLVFIGFQIPYFFGGESFVKSQGLVYAEYARTGFFQLIAAAALVFLISWAVYRFTHMRERSTQVLVSGLIAETGVILISAVMRLSLYINAYGLSVSRWWAMALVVITGFTLLVLLGATILQTPYQQISKLLLILLLFLFSAPLLYNVEGKVVRFNTQRYLSGQTDMFDLQYNVNLSSDAWPDLAHDMSKLTDRLAKTDYENREFLQRNAIQKKVELAARSIDWRNLVLSDYRAIQALSALK